MARYGFERKIHDLNYFDLDFFFIILELITTFEVNIKYYYIKSSNRCNSIVSFVFFIIACSKSHPLAPSSKIYGFVSLFLST